MTTAYQPKTGAKCGCKPGQARDNCPQCEGTGWIVDFAAIRAMNTRPRYTVERNACGYVLRDCQATQGTQILAVLQSELAAQTAAQALNRGLYESVDAQGRWEDAP